MVICVRIGRCVHRSSSTQILIITIWLPNHPTKLFVKSGENITTLWETFVVSNKNVQEITKTFGKSNNLCYSQFQPVVNIIMEMVEIKLEE